MHMLEYTGGTGTLTHISDSGPLELNDKLVKQLHLLVVVQTP